MTERCHACGNHYEEVWRAGDMLWARLVGKPDGGALLCMRCITEVAVAEGITLYWECAAGAFPSDLRWPKDAIDRVRQLEAALRRVANELWCFGGCGGVDTGHEINPDTGQPYGPGGHTGYALQQAAMQLRRRAERAEHELTQERARAARAEAVVFSMNEEGGDAANEIRRLAEKLFQILSYRREPSEKGKQYASEHRKLRGQANHVVR